MSLSELDLLLYGFSKISTRDNKNMPNQMVGIRYAYKKDNLIIYPKKTGFFYLNEENKEVSLFQLEDVKVLLVKKKVA